jgi:atypical dual specificity phosphatase
LIAKENIGGVVCLTEAHELNHSFVAGEQDWKQRNVQFHWLPTPDWTHSPTITGIRQAVHFINRLAVCDMCVSMDVFSFDGTGKSVYVHCKAGRSRSATVVACYLVTVGCVSAHVVPLPPMCLQRHQWHSATALQTIYQKRHQIVLKAPQWRTLIKYEQMELEKGFGDT